MLAPFVVVAGEKRGGPYSTDRTAYYLIDGFGERLHSGLTQLPHWQQWVAAVQSLSPKAAAAFGGADDLHKYTDEIARLKATYDALASEAAARGLKWSR